MGERERDEGIFPAAEEDVEAAERVADTPQTRAPAYRLAFADPDLLLRDELRAVRLQLELMKPELLQHDYGVAGTVVIFGSARIPDAETAARQRAQAEERVRLDRANTELQRAADVARRVEAKAGFYGEARKLARLITTESTQVDGRRLIVVTGGGPGIMEAGNRGAHDAGGVSIGLNIVLPHEQRPNRYITPELCFQFHYFGMRKMHFLLRARALVVFPGGFGTLDELFETLTLIQTQKVKPMPVLLFGEEYWRRVVNFDVLVEEGTIAPEDVDLFRYVKTAKEAWDIIDTFWRSTTGTPVGHGLAP